MLSAAEAYFANSGFGVPVELSLSALDSAAICCDIESLPVAVCARGATAGRPGITDWFCTGAAGPLALSANGERPVA